MSTKKKSVKKNLESISKFYEDIRTDGHECPAKMNYVNGHPYCSISFEGMPFPCTHIENDKLYRKLCKETGKIRFYHGCDYVK